jgi:hypothetical protein
MEGRTTAFHHRPAGADRSGTDDFVGVTQPDVLASAQYEHIRRTKILEPEKSLMLAILEDAVRCFQEHHSARCGNTGRIFRDAQLWLFASSDDWVFSFENICATLGLDPQYIRRGLRSWRAQALANEHGLPLRCGTHG